MNDLPKGWILTEIGEISEYIQRGKSPKYIYKSDLPVINQKCIRWDGVDPTYLKFIHPDQWDSWTPERFLQPGDLLWNSTGTGTIGRAALFTELEGYERAVVDSHVTIVRCNTACHPYYLHYFIKSPFIQKRIEEMHTGSTNQVELSRSEVLRTSIPLPPLGEQGRIVEKLDELLGRSRRAREELQQIPKLIQRYKQAVLAAAFRGDLTADWREENISDLTARDFLNEACIEFANGAENLPSLPNTWAWALAGNLCHIKSGIALGKKRSPGTELVELPYLRVANVQRGWLDLSEIKTIMVKPSEAERLYLKYDDILMNEGGDRDKLGRGWVWKGEIANCIHQNHVFRLRLKTDKIPSRYISYYANEFGQNYFIDQGKQTTNLASISMSKLSKFPLPIAPPKEIEQILQLIEERFKAIEAIEQNYQQAIALLDRFDQATLAQAFRGQLVPQDPNDEPASVLLERIRAQRASQPPARKRKTKTPSAIAPTQLSLDCP
ncbi:MAG: type I restriction endonuclease subunit S [Oscillatoriales cyanobacterium]|nr:MAG: type I restriction endonuclease subunit S [Oscillatoriales cyanobacterium]